MSKFTKDAPFEFELDPGRTVRIWRNDAGRVASTMDGWPARGLTAALHAFIEAERNEWAWTNDEHTEARKGRFVARASTSIDLTGQQHVNWTLTHDDFPTFPGLKGGTAMPTSKTKKAVELRRAWWDEMQGFLAWNAAQNQPAEPTGLGAVVRFDRDGRTWLIVRVSAKWWEAFVEPGKFRKCKWDEWLEDATDITILSPGVDA